MHVVTLGWVGMLVWVPATSWAAPPSTEVDPLALAAVLVDGGDADRALVVLDGVKRPEKLPLPARARFFTLRGLAHLTEEMPGKAESDLARAHKIAPRPALALSWARAAHAAHRPRRVLRALEGAQSLAATEPAVFGMRAEAHLTLWRSAKNPAPRQSLAAALATLRSGDAQFEDSRFIERETRVLAEAGLFLVAAERLRAWVVRTQGRPSTAETSAPESMLGAVDALWRAEAGSSASGRAPTTQGLLEELALRFPQDRAVARLRARALAEAQPIAAAGMYEALSRREPEAAVDAAELYRRGGRLGLAFLANERAPFGRRKVEQKFGLLLEDGRLEEAAAMQPRLVAAGLLGGPNRSDRVRFALGWALFQTQRPKEAERLLRGIQSPALFGEATALRQQIAECSSPQVAAQAWSRWEACP